MNGINEIKSQDGILCAWLLCSKLSFVRFIHIIVYICFLCWIVFHCKDYHYVFLDSWWVFGLSLAPTNNVAINILVHILEYHFSLLFTCEWKHLTCKVWGLYICIYIFFATLYSIKLFFKVVKSFYWHNFWV